MNDKELLLTTIVRLRDYQNKGYMTYYEIKSVIDEIEECIEKENSRIVQSLSEEVGQYYCDNAINQWIKQNIREAAEVLGCTERTVYRKLKDNSFTLVESTMLKMQYQKTNNQQKEIF